MSGGFRLGLTCPLCGGKLEIDAAGRTTICSHCASVLKISRSSGVPRYYIESSLSKREVKFLVDRDLKREGHSLVSSWHSLEQVYLPFWRVSGTVFKIDCPQVNYDFDIPGNNPNDVDPSEQIEVKITPRELTLCADELLPWGMTSLGVRTQVLKLTPVDAEFVEKAHLVAPSMEEAQARERFDKSALSMARIAFMGFSHLQLHSVGVETMLIYFPLWLVGFSNREGRYLGQFDPLAKRLVSMGQKEFELPEAEQPTRTAATIQIAEHRCPNCGVDLPVADSVSYYCANCRRLYAESGSGYRELKVQVPAKTCEQDRLFPFWVFDLENSQWPDKPDFLESLRNCGLQCDRIIMPAFEISNPARILRLVKHFNRQDHHLSFESLPEGRYDFVDVHHRPEQATEVMLPLLMALEAKKGQMVIEGGLRDTPRLAPPELIWLPFVPDRYFLRDELTGATIEKAAVRL